jgi:hypothetical protein
MQALVGFTISLSNINRKRYAVIRSLLSAGENADEVRCEKTGNSVLHLAVNGSSDSADQSLELESTLVKNGCNVFAVNNLKRRVIKITNNTVCFTDLGKLNLLIVVQF